MIKTAELNSVTSYIGSYPILSGATYTFRAGSVTCLVGPNGAGKTSIIKLLAGFLPITSGTLTMFGETIINGLPLPLRQRVGYLGHRPSLYEDLSVTENLLFNLRFFGASNKAASLIEAISASLSMVGLKETILSKKTRFLSEGQKRRIGLLAILLREPDLLLLDEPFAGLDSEGRTLLKEIITSYKTKNKTIVMSSHEREPLAGDWQIAKVAGGRFLR